MLSSLLHLDQTLGVWVASYGLWIYAILFLIIFCETGLVILPFLPGDSLLFAVGALCGSKMLNLSISMPLLCAAAVLGNMVNYAIGRWAFAKTSGTKILRWVNPKYIARTQQFYGKYGGTAIVLSRFMPIIRTFAPFVAGMSQMPSGSFLLYNLLGGVLWVAGLMMLGNLFGHLPLVKEHFSLMILGILVFSLVPVMIGVVRSRKKEQNTISNERFP